MDHLPLTRSAPFEEITADDGGEIVLFDLPRPAFRYEVTVTLRRDPGACAPDEGQAIAELAVAAVCAEGLVTAWASGQSVFSMLLDAADDAAALSAGVAMVRALGGTRGASVTAERLTAGASL